MPKQTSRPRQAPSPVRKAILYTRYSSHTQDGNWSTDAQVNALRGYCEAHGWEVVELAGDEAISGSHDRRPGFIHAMDQIRAGRADVLVVHKLDRFSRSMADTFRYIRELEDLGAGLVCVEQGIDTTNLIAGKVLLAVFAALAEVYLDNLSGEIRKGNAARVRAGLHLGQAPFGYRAQGAKGTRSTRVWDVDPEAAAVVRDLFERYAAGTTSLRRLALSLRDRGLVPPRGGVFQTSTVRAILCNPVYVGMIYHQGETHPGRQEAIVDQGLWDAAQAMRRRRYRSLRAEGSGPDRSYLFSGLARCAGCGRTLVGLTTRGRVSYICASKHKGLPCSARRTTVPSAILEAAVVGPLRSITFPVGWQEQLVAEYERRARARPDHEPERASLTRKLGRLQDLLIAGDIDQARYRAERDRAQAFLDALPPPPTPEDRGRLLARVQGIASLLPDLPADGTPRAGPWRELLLGAVDHITVDLDRPPPRVAWDPDFRALVELLSTNEG